MSPFSGPAPAPRCLFYGREPKTGHSTRDGVPTACCFSYQKRPVPRALITSVYITSSSCSQPGVM
uniref:Chemokine interleukin-8-like domain-containing protein n=1 Tax=Calidris pygmaea TaxID=425635 RepID=A0A8C3JKK2_9CHAR